MSSGAVASLSATFVPAPTQNNLLMCLANSEATINMTSTGWTLAVSQINNTGLYQWYKVAGASESATVTITPTSTVSVEMLVYEYSGAVTASPWDKAASAVGASTGTTAATTQADELALAAEGLSNMASAGTASWTNSFTSDGDIMGAGATSSNNTSLHAATRTLVATGAVSSVPTASIGTVSGALVATYKAAISGTTSSSTASGPGVAGEFSPHLNYRMWL